MRLTQLPTSTQERNGRIRTSRGLIAKAILCLALVAQVTWSAYEPIPAKAVDADASPVAGSTSTIAPTEEASPTTEASVPPQSTIAPEVSPTSTEATPTTVPVQTMTSAPEATPSSTTTGTPTVAAGPAIEIRGLDQTIAAVPGSFAFARYRVTNSGDADAAIELWVEATSGETYWQTTLYQADGQTPVTHPVTIPAGASLEYVIRVAVPAETRVEDTVTIVLLSGPAEFKASS